MLSSWDGIWIGTHPTIMVVSSEGAFWSFGSSVSTNTSDNMKAQQERWILYHQPSWPFMNYSVSPLMLEHSFITCWDSKHLKLGSSRTNNPVMDQSRSKFENTDPSGTCSGRKCSRQEPSFYRLEAKIRVATSGRTKCEKMVLWCWIMARNVTLKLTFWKNLDVKCHHFIILSY